MISKELQKYMPTHCPACDSELKYDEIHLYCDNKQCKGKIARKLGAAASVLDLKGIAGKTLEPFAEEFENMYELFTWVLRNRENMNTEKYGIKNDSRSKEIFIKAFISIKSLTFAQVILMMGFDGVGKKLSEQVAKDYCGLEPNYKGHERALVEIFLNEDIRTHIKTSANYLESLGVSIDKPKVETDNDALYVCLTGSPKDFGYKTKEEFLNKFSHMVEVSLIDKNCNCLITDSMSSTSSKMKIAEKKGIQIKIYGDF